MVPARVVLTLYSSWQKVLGNGDVIRIAHVSHGWAHAHFPAAVAKVLAGALGGFNRSLQHLNQGGVYNDPRSGCTS